MRACDPTYSVDPLKAINIAVHVSIQIYFTIGELPSNIHIQDMPFSDGGAPSDDVVDKWLSLLKTAYKYVIVPVLFALVCAWSKLALSRLTFY